MATQPAEPQYEAPQPAESHLWDYVVVLLRRRRLVVAVFLAIVATAALRSFLTSPVYQATAQLLIEKQNPNVLNFQGVTEERAGTGIDDYYQTQYKLLQSRSLARRVIEQLVLLNDPEYGGPREKEQIEALLTQPAGENKELEGVISLFLNRTEVRPIRNSRLVNVSVSSGRPELAAAATNALAQLYIQQSLDLRFETSSEAGQWLEMVPRKAVLHTLERLHETGARILGIVLNRAQVDKHAYYYSHYYGHYYGEYYGTRTARRHRRHGGNGKSEGSEAAGVAASEEKVARVQ